MSLFHIFFAVLTVVCLSVGQVLFKQASGEMFWSVAQFYKNLGNAKLIMALFVYAIATIMWLFVLKKNSLSLAYSFVGISFFIVPIISCIFLGEPLRWNIFIGAFLILLGIFISVK